MEITTGQALHKLINSTETSLMEHNTVNWEMSSQIVLDGANVIAIEGLIKYTYNQSNLSGFVLGAM